MVDLDEVTVYGLVQILEDWAYEYSSWEDICGYYDVDPDEIMPLIPDYLPRIKEFIKTLA